jgi:3-hydroxyisobutyrate dehydrogenase
MATTETIAVLGAGGTMGRAMARNLLRAGFSVRAWNRSPDKAQPLRADGAEVCDSAADAARGATVVLTMLADADAVIGAMEGDGGALAAERGLEPVWLQMSTNGETGTERCIELARDAEVEFVDAPVLGTKQPAEQGTLIVLASGPDRLRDRLAPMLDALGGRTMWVGGAGQGSRLKLATNSWLVTIVEGAAETLALAEGLGLDPQLVLDAVAGGPLDLPYLQMKGRSIIARDFEPSFRLALAAKDASLVQDAAGRRGLDLPLVTAIRDRLQEGVPEHGDKDISATYLTSASAGQTA